MTDPLSISIPLGDVDTSRPLLPEGDYKFQISESVVQPNRDQNGRNWHMQLNLVDPAQSVPDEKGNTRQINPNFPMFLDAPLQMKEGTKAPNWFRENLAMIVDALEGTTKDNRPDLSAEIVSKATGKIVLATIQLRENDRSHEKENSVRRLKHVA